VSGLDRAFAHWTGFGDCRPAPVPDLPAPAAPAPTGSESRTRFEGGAQEVVDAEASVLDDLAALTADHGPWKAAAQMFNPIEGDQR
jgi:hypothetical protein